MGNRTLIPFIVGLTVAACCFGSSVALSKRFVPLQMHDDFEYTYPAFSLVRAGDLGSPLRGTGLNIEHRTYHLIVYYYAAVHSVLIRVFGDRVESIPLANLFHFSLIIGILSAYAVRRPLGLTIPIAILCFATDGLVLRAAAVGRPEMTVAFGYCLATLAIYDRIVWGNRSAAMLALASCAAVASALSHTAAGVVLLSPIFLLFVVVENRHLLVPRNSLAFLLPFFIPVLLYSYFLLTDDWRHIYLQLRHEFGEQTLMRHVSALVHLRFGELWASTAKLRENFRFSWIIASVAIAISAYFARPVKGDREPAAQKLVSTVLFFGLCFFLSAAANWLCLKDYVPSYTVIYRTAYYLTLGATISLVTLWGMEIIAAATPTLDVHKYSKMSAVLIVALVAGYRISPLVRQGPGIPLASYDRFRAQLIGELMSAGAQPGDKVYCPSPFGAHVHPIFAVVTFGSDQYYSDMWSKSFDEAVEAKSSFRPEERARHFEKLVVFLSPKWIVAWENDYQTMAEFGAFLARFPNRQREIRITPARHFRSDSTYVGEISIYRVDLDPGFSGSLDRKVYPERRMSAR